ncbi:MAG TPA: AbrB/MazE/SpoVT family DNA-binding domain-containing protein [Candidatus Dormibacteraeota bacterium]|nr:AbrB/MazE/SpoVT family DNA-binding domain-containing protein [Candidatus Dormibacteraeota bacterium]
MAEIVAVLPASPIPGVVAFSWRNSQNMADMLDHARDPSDLPALDAGELLTEFRTTLGEGGRLVVPAGLRRRLGLKPGADVLLRLTEDGEAIRLTTPAAALRRARAAVRRYVPEGVSLADELVGDRRQAAAAGD